MGLVIIIKTSSDLPQKSSISSEIFSNLREFSETVWKHFRLYFRNSLVIFGNFQKMFGSISCLESLGRFWRILGNPQKAVRNLHKIINNVVIRLCPYYNKLYMAADSYMYVSSVHFYIISECTAVLSCTCTSIILTYSMLYQVCVISAVVSDMYCI